MQQSERRCASGCGLHLVAGRGRARFRVAGDRSLNRLLPHNRGRTIYRDPMDEGVRKRQDGELGIRVVRDRSLKRQLAALPIPAGRARVQELLNHS